MKNSECKEYGKFNNMVYNMLEKFNGVWETEDKIVRNSKYLVDSGYSHVEGARCLNLRHYNTIIMRYTHGKGITIIDGFSLSDTDAINTFIKWIYRVDNPRYYVNRKNGSMFLNDQITSQKMEIGTQDVNKFLDECWNENHGF